MKKFFFKILLSLTPLIALYLVDFVYSQVAMHSNYKPSVIWYDLMHGKIDADVIAMGNSHAQNYINPFILDSVLNVNSYILGAGGQNINEFVLKYDLYRQKNFKPNLIIQDINLYTLAYRVGYEIEQYYPYFWNISMRQHFYNTEPLSIQEKYLPLYRYCANGFWTKEYQRAYNTFYKGFYGLDTTYDGSKLADVDSISFTYNHTTDSLFDMYLAQTKSEGIKMVFVYSPSYIEALEKISNMDEMYSFYQRYADKYDIPILDFTYMDISYDTTFFFNATHVNRLGAAIFTDSLANGIKSLGLW